MTEQIHSQSVWYQRVAKDLMAGEMVSGAFQATLAGDDAGLLAITNRRLIFYGSREVHIPYRQVAEVVYEHGYASADVFALPNELIVKTAARTYRLFLLGPDSAAQEQAARRARDIITTCRAQCLLLERMM